MEKFKCAFGTITIEEHNEERATEPLRVSFLDDMKCRFAFDEAYNSDENKSDYYHAINNFLSLNKNVLTKVNKYAFQYYQDVMEELDSESDRYVYIDSEKNIWKHVQFCNVLIVSRNEEDHNIYICLGGSCDWEPEHGIQIVFKNGSFVNRLSEIDFILTNSDPTMIYE